MPFDIRNLKVGDEVAIIESNGFSFNKKYRFSVVTGITKSGRINVRDEGQFTPNNKKVASTAQTKYGQHTRHFLSDPETIRQVIKDRNEQNDKDARMALAHKTAEDFFAGLRNGYGNYVGQINEDARNNLITLIKNL